MNIGILGTGAFGIAIASVLNSNKHKVTMWSKFEEEINNLNDTRTSPNLNGYIIPREIKFTNSIKEVVENKDIIFLVVPANFIHDTTELLKTYFKKNQHICIASKGIEESRGRFLHNIVEEILNTKNISIISGPSFAIDIVQNVPVGVTLASNNHNTANIVAKSLRNNYFKVSCINDMVGVSICGCVKNIIAIGSGIIDGMNLPISTNSLLITIALNDIRTLIKALNGDENTILELAGIGDIILTCTSSKSRNYSFGKLIGESDNQEVINNYVHKTTIEGISAIKNINEIVDNLNINTPFIKLMHNIILGNKHKQELIDFIIKSNYQ